MEKELVLEKVRRSWSLLSDVTYAVAPAWYGSVRQSMKMSLLVPKTQTPGEKMPVLVWFCGGGFQVVDKDVWIPQWTEFAMKHNCVVASVNYRTSNDVPFPACLQDAKAAIRFLRAHAEQFSIDPDRVFAGGESAGGAIASLLGTTGNEPEFDVGDFKEYSSAVQGVIDYYGVVDVTGRIDPVKNAWTVQYLGGLDNCEANAVKASAILHADSETAPFLIFHGDADPLVPVQQSRDMYRVLTEKGISADLYIMKGQGHGTDAFYQPEVLEIVAEFMDRVCGR